MQLTAQTVGIFVAWLATLVTLGAWTTATFLRPSTGDRRLVLKGDPLVRVAQASSVVALLAIASQIVQTSHDGSASAPSTGWLFTGIMMGGALLVGLLPRFETALYALALGTMSLIAPVAVRETVVPRNHDITGDATVVAIVAFTVLAGIWVCSLMLRPDERRHPVVIWRLRFTSLVAAAVVVVCDLTTVLIRGDIDTNATWHLVRIACAVVIAALSFAGSRVTTFLAAVLGVFGQFAAVQTLLIIPHGTDEVLPVDARAFGYSVANSPTLHNLALEWRINLFFLGVAVAAIAVYLVLVAQLKRRGDHWSSGRTFAWVLGWLIVVFLTSSGVGRYAPAVFSVHMFMNLGLNMLAAMILVLGGFMTLVLRATPARRAGEPAGLREWVTASMHTRFVALMYNPIIALVFMTGTYYVFYLTSLYVDSLQGHWLHQYFYLHFLVTGYIFYGLIIGVDQPLHPLPHIGKLGLIIGAMPFHAFFGVILMGKQNVFAEAFLKSLGHPWLEGRGLMHDQWVGGTIAWAGGEFPLVIALIALLTQWSRQDSKEGRRIDRHLDAGTDQSYDAYNDMLSQLAERDRSKG